MTIKEKENKNPIKLKKLQYKHFLNSFGDLYTKENNTLYPEYVFYFSGELCLFYFFRGNNNLFVNAEVWRYLQDVFDMKKSEARKFILDVAKSYLGVELVEGGIYIENKPSVWWWNIGEGLLNSEYSKLKTN